LGEKGKEPDAECERRAVPMGHLASPSVSAIIRSQALLVSQQGL
jgi:hypothetical protein